MTSSQSEIEDILFNSEIPAPAGSIRMRPYFAWKKRTAKKIVDAGFHRDRVLDGPDGLETVSDRGVIRTKGGIILARYDNYFAPGVTGWERMGREWVDHTEGVADPVHFPATVIDEGQSAPAGQG